MTIKDELLYQHIGKQIKSIRQELDISQDVLAKRVRITRTSITNIERGFQKLPLHLLYDICDALGVEVAMILPEVREVSEATDINQERQISEEIASFVQRAEKDLSEND